MTRRKNRILLYLKIGIKVLGGMGVKSKLIKSIVACLIVVGVGFGGYFGYQAFSGTKAAASSSVRYMTVTANKMNLEVNIQGTGSAFASVSKDLAPNNNGTLEDLNVKAGDKVTAGQKLFTAASDELSEAVIEAKTNLSQAKIELSTARSDLADTKTALATAKTQLAAALKSEAEAKAKAAQQTQTTNTQAGNAGQNTTQNAAQGNVVNTVQNTNGSSGTSSAEIQQKIDQYESQITSLNTQIEKAKLSVSSAEEKLDSANDALSNATVKSPIDGIVTAVNNINGDTLQQGKAVLTVVDMSSLKIKVSVDELDISKIKEGQSAEVKFDAIEDKTYEGTVESIAEVGTSNNNVTTYDVVVDIDDPTEIKLGMNANVNILVQSKEDALVIPSEALVERDGKKYVRVDDSESNTSQSKGSGSTAVNAQAANTQNTNAGNAGSQDSSQNSNSQVPGNRGSFAGVSTSSGKLVEIKTGIENENYIEVTEGVTEGERLLVSFNQSSTTTTNANTNKSSNRNSMGGMGGFPGGSFPTGRN